MLMSFKNHAVVIDGKWVCLIVLQHNQIIKREEVLDFPYLVASWESAGMQKCYFTVRVFN